MLYQTSAKHALKKVYNERMEAIQKLGSVENALCSTEDECSLMKDQLTKTQTHSQETTQRLDAMQTQLDVKVTDYEEKIFKKETELKSLNTELSELQEKLGNYKVSSLLELTLMNALAETFLFFAATKRHRRLRELATCYKLASQIRHQEHWRIGWHYQSDLWRWGKSSSGAKRIGSALMRFTHLGWREQFGEKLGDELLANLQQDVRPRKGIELAVLDDRLEHQQYQQQ